MTLIDCGPSRYTIWKGIRTQGSQEMVNLLNVIFLERGPPLELLLDNATAFRGNVFQSFANKWGVKLRFRCVNVASGNAIVERCHRSVKRIAARKNCEIGEAVYLYNISPTDDENASSAPANGTFSYEVRVRDIDSTPDGDVEEIQSRYTIGDLVWVSRSPNRCDVPYKRGTVTKILSPQSVEVDGHPQHIRNLRPRNEVSSGQEDPDGSRHSEEPLILHFQDEAQPVPNGEEPLPDAPDVEPRRSVRMRNPPDWYGV